MKDKYLIEIAEILEKAGTELTVDPTDYNEGYAKGVQKVANIVLLSLAEGYEIEQGYEIEVR